MHADRRTLLIGCTIALALAILAVDSLAKKRANTPASRPTANQAAKPAPTEYPPRAVVEACEQAAKDLRKQLDDTFAVIVKPPFVIAGNMSADDVQAHAQGSVLSPADAMWKSYFKHKPDKVITVLLFTDQGVAPPKDDKAVGYVYRKWARQLFNDTDVSYYGYYKPDKRTMVMNIDTGGGTLVHELTHALIVYDFANVPDWFNEGMGSLHEQCNISKDEVIGLENWRLPALQKAIQADKLRSLRDLISQDNFRDKRIEGMNYAHARYFVMYMQHKGLLKDFYVYLRDHYDKDPEGAAVAGVEKLFKEKVEKVEKDYIAYVKTLHFPPRR
jgi:hypothetical protein